MNRDLVISMLKECISLLQEDMQDVDSKLKETVNYNNTINMTPARPIRERIIEIARSYIGKIPYVYGGKDKRGIDCSGFVQMVLKEAGVCPTNTITNSTGMRQWGKETTNPRPGDIVCYNGHVALYSGNNKIIDSGNSVKGISERSVNIMQVLMYRNVVGD